MIWPACLKLDLAVNHQEEIPGQGMIWEGVVFKWHAKDPQYTLTFPRHTAAATRQDREDVELAGPEISLRIKQAHLLM